MGSGIYPHKIIDEVGNRYGMLTVINISDLRLGKERVQMWLCRCDCGKEVIVRGTGLREGRTTNCGCQRNMKIGLAHIQDITGQTFGQLTAIRRTEVMEGGCYVWECRCSCGRYCFRQIKKLKCGSNKSCGCLNKPFTEKEHINSLYNKYKRIAIQRKREFNLSLEEFGLLIKDNCKYCGTPPMYRMKKRNKYLFVYNGIDRVDNNIGYIKSNCVTCCGNCNTMKFNLTKEKFLEHIKNIYFYQFMQNKS